MDPNKIVNMDSISRSIMFNTPVKCQVQCLSQSADWEGHSWAKVITHATAANIPGYIHNIPTQEEYQKTSS